MPCVDMSQGCNAERGSVQVLGTDTWLEGGLTGTQRSGGLTEAQLTDELGPEFDRFPIPRNASATISWWQLRQAAFNRAVQVLLFTLRS